MQSLVALVHLALGGSIREGGVEKEWRKGWLPWGAVPSLSRSAELCILWHIGVLVILG